jgi:hypothetical protein
MDESQAVRYPIPTQIAGRVAGIAKWMRTVGIIQSVFSGLAFLMFAFSLLTSFGRFGVLGAAVVLASLVGLFFTGVYFRQALMLQSAAEHLAEVQTDPDDAHDHLVLAFSRLRTVFMLDLVAASLWLTRDLLTLGG